MRLEPPELPTGQSVTLEVRVERCLFRKNWASLALIYVSQGANFTVLKSSFTDNFSTGRGSIVFAESLNALANIYDTQFSHNYAIRGGVFYS
jgi:hypothetical protein